MTEVSNAMPVANPGSEIGTRTLLARSKVGCRARRISCVSTGLLLTGAMLLSGCGKSTDERRTEVVRCSGYIQAFQIASLTNRQVESFLTALTPMSVGRPSYDSIRINAVARLGDQLAPALDQVRATAAATDGAQEWAKQYGAKDSKAVLDFLDACIGNYDELLKAAR